MVARNAIGSKSRFFLRESIALRSARRLGSIVVWRTTFLLSEEPLVCRAGDMGCLLPLTSQSCTYFNPVGLRQAVIFVAQRIARLAGRVATIGRTRCRLVGWLNLLYWLSCHSSLQIEPSDVERYSESGDGNCSILHSPEYFGQEAPMLHNSKKRRCPGCGTEQRLYRSIH